MPDDWTRALAVVAHPDDMEFGSAGAVAAWTAAGKTVGYLVVSRGEAGIDGMPPQVAADVREQEQRASAKVVGVESVEFLDHADGAIEYGPRLRQDIARAIRRFRPELVVAYNHHDTTYTGKWNTPDHRHTGRAVLDAVGEAANRWLPRDQPGDTAPADQAGDAAQPWAGVRHVAVAASPYPTHAVDVSETLDAAVASVEAHAAYLAGLGLPAGAARGALTAFTTGVGERFGGRPAVPFELIEV